MNGAPNIVVPAPGPAVCPTTAKELTNVLGSVPLMPITTSPKSFTAIDGKKYAIDGSLM
jgi:hypothetical protein